MGEDPARCSSAYASSPLATTPWYHDTVLVSTLLDTDNAILVVSENHGTAPAAFREPLPLFQANPGNCRRCRFHAFMANGGYRTHYPLVAAATSSQLGC
jgi:hypothetical protein